MDGISFSFTLGTTLELSLVNSVDIRVGNVVRNYVAINRKLASLQCKWFFKKIVTANDFACNR